jgi:hypothetical protein
MIAGEDAAAVERLARFQQPGDLWKSYRELEGKLSKRAEPVRLADDAKPEQIAEYRKGLGIPEVAADAKPEAYLQAYKIEPPKGYQLTEVESGALSDYAKLAYERGHSPREVKAATDFFFQQQEANSQALNRIAVDFMKKEQNALRDELGSKEYEAQQAAGEAWLKSQFAESPDELTNLLHAQLPGGGKLGDSSWFFKLVAKQAMGEGYTDRIEANSFESNGKSLAIQQREIESLFLSDRAAYNLPENQAKLKRIIGMRQTRGEIDEQGNERKRA